MRLQIPRNLFPTDRAFNGISGFTNLISKGSSKLRLPRARALMDDIVSLYEETTFLPSTKQLFISRRIEQPAEPRSLARNRSHNSRDRKWQKSLSQAYESRGHLRELVGRFSLVSSSGCRRPWRWCRSGVGARRRGGLPLLLSLFMSNDIAAPRRLRAP